MINPDILKQHPFFVGLDEFAVTKVALLGEEVMYEENEWIFFEGDEADALYLILNGAVELRVTFGENEDRFVVLNTLQKGEMLGWSSLVYPYVYKLDAIVPKDTILIRFGGGALRKLFKDEPEVGYKMMLLLSRAMGERLTELRQRFVQSAED